jgi:hypothetical protein
MRKAKIIKVFDTHEKEQAVQLTSADANRFASDC